MAEFGVSATQLSEPQGSGSTPLRPVESLPNGPNQLVELGSSVLEIFSKGVSVTRKEEAEKRKNAIVQGFVREETSINDAIVSGQMTPSQAAARSRANFNKYASGFSEYISDFEAAGKALRGFTETGEVQQSIQSERELRKKALDQAVSRGFTTYEGMGKAAEDSIIKASQSGIQAEREMQQFYASQQERRSQGDFDTRIADAEGKRLSVKLINTIAGDNLSAFQALGADLGDKVRKGTIDPARAQVLLGERFSNISAAIQSAAGVHPELASAYRSLFNEANTLGQKLIDPKANADDVEAQYRSLLARYKTAAISDPSDASVIVGNMLIPNSVRMQVEAIPRIPSILARIANTPYGSKGFVPQVVGDPQAEGPILESLKEVLPKLKGTLIGDKELATLQASNSINHILGQVGKSMDNGADAKSLSQLAAFFADPRYGEFVKSGKVDSQAQAAALKTFQLNFEPTIIKGVQQKMEEYLYSQAVFARGKSADPKQLKNVVDVKFTGSGITFVTKDVKGLDPVEARSQIQALEELKVAQKAINQLIHIGTHFEGSTDYAKFWEAHKHEFLPFMFAPPKKAADNPSYGTEKQLRDTVKLAPLEQQVSDRFEQSPGNMKELEDEISRTNNPTIKAILQTELDKLKEEKKNAEKR